MSAGRGINNRRRTGSGIGTDGARRGDRHSPRGWGRQRDDRELVQRPDTGAADRRLRRADRRFDGTRFSVGQPVLRSPSWATTRSSPPGSSPAGADRRTRSSSPGSAAARARSPAHPCCATPWAGSTAERCPEHLSTTITCSSSAKPCRTSRRAAALRAHCSTVTGDITAVRSTPRLTATTPEGGDVMKKIQVRKPGSVRLTARANYCYGCCCCAVRAL